MLRLKTPLTEHRDLFRATTGFGDRSVDLDLANPDVREFSPFTDQMRANDARLRKLPLKVVRVTFVDLQNGRARFIRPIRKNKTRRLPGFEPDAEFNPTRFIVRQRGLA